MTAVLLVGCKLTRQGCHHRLVVASSGSRLGRAPLHNGKRRATVGTCMPSRLELAPRDVTCVSVGDAFVSIGPASSAVAHSLTMQAGRPWDL